MPIHAHFSIIIASAVLHSVIFVFSLWGIHSSILPRYYMTQQHGPCSPGSCSSPVLCHHISIICTWWSAILLLYGLTISFLPLSIICAITSHGFTVTPSFKTSLHFPSLSLAPLVFIFLSLPLFIFLALSHSLSIWLLGWLIACFLPFDWVSFFNTLISHSALLHCSGERQAQLHFHHQMCDGYKLWV